MDDEGIPHDDPRFVEILEACLHMEIASHKESYTRIQGEVRKIKRNVLTKLERRKELKKKIEDAKDLISTLNVTLKKLQEHVRETEQRIELIEAKVDDRSKLKAYEMQRYRDILQEYERTWKSYRAKYEEFPLAKKRREAEVNVKKACIEKMLLEFKIKEMEKKIQQKKSIDCIRMRLKIIEFARVVGINEKSEKGLTDVKAEIDLWKQKLRTKELELNSLREQEEEERKIRATQLLEMPPPKINLSRVRLNYSRKWQELQFKKQTSELDADSMSVNTIALEEMCIREESSQGMSKRKKVMEAAGTSSMLSDRESTPSFSSQIDERETRATKNVETCVETMPLRKDTYGKKDLSFTGNIDVVARERSFKERDTHKRTMMRVQEEDKYSVNYDRNQFADNVYELKRMKKVLRREEKDDENMERELSQPSLKLVNEEKESSAPRITKIEKVQYGIAPLMKRKSVLDTSISHNLEANESHATSFTLNDALLIKELNASRSVQQSVYGDNSSNFKFSDCANVSNLSNMNSVDVDFQKVDCKENEKETSAKATSRFNFSDLLKQTNNNFLF
ncbi:hypothetical protein KPH14_003928 [Odynerus spinipes]|uniref:Uncharacterized protein n=1 Tax=Odynerus spinipes TaxID=1348599 RepID=A0AAD9RYG7_9HYME|nr:hypothetical protein KPH14_003928 [Odynerus spinipes]